MTTTPNGPTIRQTASEAVTVGIATICGRLDHDHRHNLL